MAQDDEVASDDRSQAKAGRPTGLGLVARRMSFWSTNLLVTALIVVIALTAGRQMMDWWRTDSTTPGDRDQVADVLGDSSVGQRLEAHHLEFGEMPVSLGYREFVGNADGALAELRKTCRATLVGNDLPLRLPGPAEKKMLRDTLNWKPVEASHGQWQLYQLHGPMLMVVGVRDDSIQSEGRAGANVAARERRVVSWGFGVPGANEEWTLFTFPAAKQTTGTASEIPLKVMPAGCRRTMLMHADGGAGVAAFRGMGTSQEWKDEFDRRFARIGWQIESPWQTGGDVWRARFANQRGLRADVLFTTGNPAAMLGVVSVTSVINKTGN